jgi:uncharacterized protein YoxC
MIIEISVAVIALAFVFLVVYLAVTLISLKRTLDQVRQNLIQLNAITIDLEAKTESLNSLFETVSLLGDKMHQKVETFCTNDKAKSKKLHYETEENSEDRITDILEWLSGGIRLWCVFKKRR